ncbi:hypothetical protein IK112_00110 [Candidatus Saccharibacteria bacterium]|nr:hypothetical protein [Candidatus Saccharibacteria bacterium]
MNPSLIFLLIAIVIVGILVFIAVSITSKRRYSFDKEDYQVDWLKIENSLAKDNKQSYNAAVIDADKLLDKALNEMGVPGKTMGERMKRSSNYFSQLNSVWYAHKMRNQIAHEHGFSVDYNQAKHALASYKQALKDLGAI